MGARDKRRHKVPLSATVTEAADKRLSEIADEFCRGNRSEAVDWAIHALYAKVITGKEGETKRSDAMVARARQT